MRSTWAALLMVGVMAAGCNAPSPTGSDGRVGDSSSGASSRAAVKRITLGVAREQDFRPSGGGPELVAFHMKQPGRINAPVRQLLQAAVFDGGHRLENGLWKLLPD